MIGRAKDWIHEARIALALRLMSGFYSIHVWAIARAKAQNTTFIRLLDSRSASQRARMAEAAGLNDPEEGRCQ